MEIEYVRKSRKYIVHGDPVPLARPRFCVEDSIDGSKPKGRAYDPQKAVRLVLGLDLKRQHGKELLFEGPLHLEVIFYLKGVEYKKGHYHATRPDLSNLLKMVEDVGTGILFKDDAQISSINAKKEYAAGERKTEFTIYQLEHFEGTKRTSKNEPQELGQSKKKSLRF